MIFRMESRTHKTFLSASGYMNLFSTNFSDLGSFVLLSSCAVISGSLFFCF